MGTDYVLKLRVSNLDRKPNIILTPRFGTGKPLPNTREGKSPVWLHMSFELIYVSNPPT